MYEQKVDKKISRRAAIQGILIGSIAFFTIVFFVHPLIFPSEETGQGKVFTGLKKGQQKSFSVDRGTISVLFGLLGGLIGFSVSKGFALDMQRRRDLKILIEQGKNRS